MEPIVNKVWEAILRARLVEVEVSARHVHLSPADLITLFGPDVELIPKRPLSQPGQFLSEQRITIVGPKGRMERTAILGPVRPATQVELSQSDCVKLGVKAPVRQSGDVAGSGVCKLEGPCGSIEIPAGAIIAHNHVHLTPDVANMMDVHDKQRVSVQVLTERPVTFDDVIIRVSEKSRCKMHIDFDEANAALVNGFTLGRIIT
ncbi:MAG: phosphate propanoyltransferase [Clostridia bacterium]|nr:phosphate propanoyltransferase [Clostridia bacterium]